MISNYGALIPNGLESRIVITPTISTASLEIRKLPVRVRQCLFQEENYLTYYR